MKISDSTRSQSAATSPAAAQLQGDQAPWPQTPAPRKTLTGSQPTRPLLPQRPLAPWSALAGGPVVAPCREMQKSRRSTRGGG